GGAFVRRDGGGGGGGPDLLRQGRAGATGGGRFCPVLAGRSTRDPRTPTIARVTQPRRTRTPRLHGRAAGVVLAGGSGTRVGAGINKAFLPLAGRSIAAWGLNTLAAV